MSFTAQYFKDAQSVIMDVLHTAKPELTSLMGRVEHEHKADDTVVTRLDKELETKLKEALTKFDSGVGFWGEEHGREGSQQHYWLIDPIDGTEQFIRGWPDARNMLTFIANDVSQFALSYVFARDELYLAERGKGATKNGQRLKMSDRPLKRAWLEFSVNLMSDDSYKIYKTLRPHVAGLPSTYHFFYIVDGYLDGTVVYKSKGQIWDYAPRALFIEEAGGRVANFDSQTYSIHDQHWFGSNAVIFEQLQNLLSGLA